MQLGGGANNVGSTEINDGAIVNDDINAAAAIAYSKLNLTNEIVNADIDDAAAIAYSKLNLADSVDSDDMAEGMSKRVVVNLSAADILALHTTPKALLAAPGANKIHVIERMDFFFDFGTQYQLGNDIAPRYVGGSVALTGSIAEGTLQAAADYVGTRETTNGTAEITAGINAGVELAIQAGTAYTTGTGTLRVIISYRTITLA
jgi:hypothetical protein